jgi:hypothetical protein
MDYTKIVQLWNQYKNTEQMAKQLKKSARQVRHIIGKMKQENIILAGYRYTDSSKKRYGEETIEYKPPSNRQLNLNIQNGTIIVFSDAHIIPGENLSTAASALLKVSSMIKPNFIIDGGDTFDFSTISKHDKLGWESSFSVREEIVAGNEFLDQVRGSSPGSRFIMLGSNHDVRFNKFLAKHAPQFRGLKGFTFEDQVPNWEHVMAIMINNNVMFLHQYHGGVHAAYNNALKGGISVITGHTHILEVKPFADYRGLRFGVQTGTLSTIKDNPLFHYTQCTPLNWTSGFAVLTFIDGELQFPEICYVNSNNKAFFRGKIIE